jgi:hypothetical protein
MTDQACTLPQLRHQLDVAQALAKSRVAFVVIPVTTSEGFEALCREQIGRLEAIAAAAPPHNPAKGSTDE